MNDKIIELKAQCFDIDNNINYLNEEKRKRLIQINEILSAQKKEESVKKEEIEKNVE